MIHVDYSSHVVFKFLEHSMLVKVFFVHGSGTVCLLFKMRRRAQYYYYLRGERVRERENDATASRRIVHDCSPACGLILFRSKACRGVL